jgi:hypothetical protein
MDTARHIHDDTRRVVRTLWSWLRRAGTAEMPSSCTETRDTTGDGVACRDPADERGTILQFPVRGDALLVKLADALRRRMIGLGRTAEALHPTLSHGPELRLSIDEDAHVAFDACRSEYDLTIETRGGARMIIQTADFDVLVTYVLQYVAERRSGDDLVGVAS